RHRVRRLRIVCLPYAGRRFHSARHRRRDHAGRGIAAWSGAWRTRRHRRLSDAHAGIDGAAELLGAVRLSRGGGRRDLRARPVPAVLASGVVVKWAVGPAVESLILPAGPASGLIPDPPRFDTNTHLMLGLFYGALFGFSGFLAQGRSTQPRISITWAVTAAVT